MAVSQCANLINFIAQVCLSDSGFMNTFTTHTARTSRLDIEYLEWNPEGRRTAVLVHGWPDSVRTWFAVAPLLVGA